MNINSTLDTVEILNGLDGHLSSFDVIKGSLDSVFVQINEEIRGS